MPQQPRAYADIAGSFRRGAGRTYASQGDFDRAIAIDADNADTYAGLQDRRERREREATTRSGQEALTRAVATNDYRGAENVAAKMGDPTALASVRTMRTQYDDTQRTEAYRRGQRLVADLEGIQGLPEAERPNAYMAIRNREIEAARADGADASAVDAILPPAFTPMALGAARGRASAMLRAIMDPEDIARMDREAAEAERSRRVNLTPQEVRAAGLRPGTVAQRDGNNQIYVLQQPPAGGGGSRGAQYRPITPQEAQAYGLPNNGQGYAMGSNGRPIRVTGAGAGGQGQRVGGSAEQRGRVGITFQPAFEASQAMETMEAGGYRPHHDWGAAVLDGVPNWAGGRILDPIARMAGGADINEAQRGDYGRYSSASSAFEAAMLPILSGAAVTESEAARQIRAVLPQVGDSDQVLADKSRRRRQMLNGAAQIGGFDIPYPEEAVMRIGNDEGAPDGEPDGYDPDDPTTWSAEQRRQWLEENPE